MKNRTIAFWAVLLVALGMALTAGCTMAGRDTLKTYAVMKLVENNTVEVTRVLDAADQVEALLSHDSSTLAELGNVIRDRLDYSERSRADQYLIDAMLADLSYGIEASPASELTDDIRERLRSVLGRVRAAVETLESPPSSASRSSQPAYTLAQL